MAACACLMTWETQDLFFKADPALLLFVGTATLATYFFHGLVNTVYSPASHQHAWNLRHRTWLLLGFIVSVLATICLGWPYRHDPFPFILLAIAAFLYSAPNIPIPAFRALQKIAIGKTVYLALAWTMVTTVLPMWVSHMKVPEGWWWFLGHRFYLLLAICILFDLRDHRQDAEKGVRSMPTMASLATVRWIFYASLVLSAIMATGIGNSIINPWMPPLLVLAFQYNKATKPRHDAYYTLFLDGMMASTALLRAVFLFPYF